MRLWRRTSISWVLLGALAIIGAYTLSLWILIHGIGGFLGSALTYASHGISAAVGGALMVSCAPLRAWREPLAGGITAIAVLAVLFLVEPAPTFRWTPSTYDAPWLIAGAIAALSGAAATIAAVVRQRLSDRVDGHVAPTVLSALVMMGMMSVLAWGIAGFGVRLTVRGSSILPLTVVLLGVLFAAAFAVQIALPVLRAWHCGVGAVLVELQGIVVSYTAGHSSGPLAAVLLGLPIGLVIGYAGARLAWALVGHRRAPEPRDVVSVFS